MGWLGFSLEQPSHHLENLVHPSSFTQIQPILTPVSSVIQSHPQGMTSLAVFPVILANNPKQSQNISSDKIVFRRGQYGGGEGKGGIRDDPMSGGYIYPLFTLPPIRGGRMSFIILSRLDSILSVSPLS